MNNKERIKGIIFIIVVITVATICIIVQGDKKPQEESKEDIVKKDSYELTGNYNIDLIKKFHEVDGNKNYLISPYNIEIALNMLRDGSDGKTKEELDKVLGERVINDVSIKDKIGIANSVFIKNDYKNNVKEDYYNILNTKYNSDIIYDEFATPDKINNWVNEKTNGMISKILDSISKDYVMGLASALSIDVKWLSEFECNRTTEEEFIKTNNEKINVEMMHKTFEYGAKYIKTDEVEGIVIPYQKEDNSSVELEFIGLLPTTSVDSFIKNLTIDKLNNIINSQKEIGDNLHVNLSLPRFKYDYEPDDFIDILNKLGINEAFNPDGANFRKMIEIDVYVGEAIHKTHIELNEKGTKAAAITYFGMYKNASIPKEVETINIKFNKPFVYMIREKNTGELLFFGVVLEPSIWNGLTCSND